MPEQIKLVPHTAGLHTTVKAIEAGKAKQVFIAEDCDVFVSRRIRELCAQCGIAYSYVPTMKELGESCGLEVKTACAALI